jgi:hypothetical protein
MAIQRLTAAYRSRSRPSSTLGAKASTVCPYYLDGDLQWVQLKELRPVIPVYIGYCAVFKVREEQSGAAAPTRPRRMLWRAGGCRSLKTQQHAVMVTAPEGAIP